MWIWRWVQRAARRRSGGCWSESETCVVDEDWEEVEGEEE